MMPDTMMMEMTEAEQNVYLPHKARKIIIVDGGLLQSHTHGN